VLIALAPQMSRRDDASVRLGRLVSFLFLVPVAMMAQTNPRALVSKMVQNELASQRQPQYWMYLDRDSKPEKTETDRVIQLPQCWVSWPVSINGHTPSDEEREHAREQLEKLINDPDARKKNRDNIDSDGRKSAAMLKTLPDAFLFFRDGHVGKSIRLKFRPNPKYEPSSREAKVFHSMEGILLIDAKQTRLARLSGRLVSDVDFGFGILGRLEKGGTFEVVQSEVAPNDWELSLLDVHITGRALFFHTIGEQQHEVRSQFKPVPLDLTVAEAISIAARDSKAASAVSHASQ
jgi:hypothetical protein